MVRTAASIAVSAAVLACGSGAVQAARGAGSSAPIGLSAYGRIVWNLDALVRDRYGPAHVCMRATALKLERRLGRALEELEAAEPALPAKLAASEPVTARTRAGELRIVPEPWGTRGYDDLRIRAFRENLGRGARPQVASLVDCVRMLEASEREPDAERLLRLRRLMELERQLVPERGLSIDL